jgi:hypothetical protein
VLRTCLHSRSVERKGDAVKSWNKSARDLIVKVDAFLLRSRGEGDCKEGKVCVTKAKR